MAKARKENALLAATLSLSRDRHERRIDYLEHSKDIESRNLQKRVRRETLEEAQILMNNILISNSLPIANIGSSAAIDPDEVPRAKDNDYYYESGDETLDDEGNLRDKNGNIIAFFEYVAEPVANVVGEESQDIVRDEPPPQEVQQEANAEKSASGLPAENLVAENTAENAVAGETTKP